MKILILKLEGPLLSFGDVAVDELRPTARHPFKSMIVGLLGNALGYKRVEGKKLDDLQASFSMASRIDRPGRVMTDYQTVMTNENDPAKPTFVGTGGWTSRPVRLRTNNETIQIYRDYVVDSSVTVAIAFKDEAFLEEVSGKLRRPERPLFIGRKACPPTRPIFESVVEADSLIGALRSYALTDAPVTGQKVSCRTEAGERELVDGHFETMAIRDLKNWNNNYHSTNRQVVECLIEVN
jgi:CRISPR system Cascade subunit CasD